MRVERVVIRKLRALRDRDDLLASEDGSSLGAVCLRGLNGSGKSTYLQALAQLWQWFHRCTQRGGYAKPEAKSLLLEAELVAALVDDLPGPKRKMWIAWGDPAAVGAVAATDEHSPFEANRKGPTWRRDLLDFWTRQIAEAEAGLESPRVAPNVVWIEAENKYVPKLRSGELTSHRPTPSFVSVARYLPEARGLSHLDGVLRTLFLARRERWELLSKALGELRAGLRLLDRFDESSQRPLLELATGETVTLEQLSAGERSLLINLATVLRWLAPGGLVLLDEPKLHLHVSLVRASLAILEDLVTGEEFRGQLIVASHASEVWDHFRRPGRILDLDGSP